MDVWYMDGCQVGGQSVGRVGRMGKDRRVRLVGYDRAGRMLRFAWIGRVESSRFCPTG